MTYLSYLMGAEDIKDNDLTSLNVTIEEKMYEAYRSYYGDKVTPDTIVKMVDFKLI